MKKLLQEPPSKLVKQFLYEYANLPQTVKASPAFDISKAFYFTRTDEYFEHLTERWYSYLKEDNLAAAYSVYDDDYYVTDLWNCFKTCSRKYLKQISTVSLPEEQKPFTEIFKSVQCVMDIGCGIGYSTSILKQLFPEANVYGTNLQGTKQFEWCRKMAEDYKWKLAAGVEMISEKSGVVFASEYFEHILDPVKHLQEIIQKIEPRCFVIANAFNTRSIGHFIEYQHNGSIIPQAKISRQFNNCLCESGYKKMKTKFWNNRPSLWVKL